MSRSSELKELEQRRQDPALANLDPSPNPVRLQRDWRKLFSSEILAEAEGDAPPFLIQDFQVLESKAYAWRYLAQARFSVPEQVSRRGQVTATVFGAPQKGNPHWEKIRMECSCPSGRAGACCVHLAAILSRWEMEHGPWVVTETEEEFERRQRNLKLAEALDRQIRLQTEIGRDELPALSFFADKPKQQEPVFYDLEQILDGYTTDSYARKKAQQLLQLSDSCFSLGISTEKSRWGEEYLKVLARVKEETGEREIGIKLSPTTFLGVAVQAVKRNLWVREGMLFYDMDLPEQKLDGLTLAVLSKVWDFLLLSPQGGPADCRAERFFAEIDGTDAGTENAGRERKSEKEKTLLLTARIVQENGVATLGFKAGRAGGRILNVRGLPGLVEAYRLKAPYSLSRTEMLNFGRDDFTEECRPLLEFLIRRVGEVESVNEKLNRHSYYGRYSSSLSMGSMLTLEGTLLDSFYDVLEGSSCELNIKEKGRRDMPIAVRHEPLSFSLRIDAWRDARGTLAGVELSGSVPVLMEGSLYRYSLSQTALSRISEEERRLLAPFQGVADRAGAFRFRVERSGLQELYYRVLPKLAATGAVEVADTCANEVRTLLPPEMDIAFYLDYEKGKLTARVECGSEDEQYTLSPTGFLDKEGHPISAARRDEAQERRVRRVLDRWFESWGSDARVFESEPEDRELFDFLRFGLEELSAHGTVSGSDSFRRLAVRPAPPVTVGVSVGGGLLDLGVTSEGLEEDELLQLLESYRVRKKFYRLKTGDFLDLDQAESLSEVERLLDQLDLMPSDVLQKKVQLPLYRALYLDRILEEHDALIASRDRTFRSLARNFHSIRDADCEVPSSLKGVLRPYQEFGFKWLHTLENAGFGGILADEMGLGKTLQMIALLLYDKEQRAAAPSLIVCPASLVYNWQEEIRRFAPELRCRVVTQTAAARKKTLEEWEETDVFVTSYDLLRRDIPLYRERFFHMVVLDEAQYIKNARAVATRAVKALQGECRFALTGTPIENRLAELWSIFDFLMPGFLYGQPEFTSRFEIPIAREKDEAATERLKQMTSPFILRRRKEDVLKDLPAKLEEIRYARVEGEQQKLYDAQVVKMRQMLETGGESGEDRMRIFAELMRIRQICCDPVLVYEDYTGTSAKRETCLETIRVAVDGGHRLLVFSQFTSMLALLEADLLEAGIAFYKITGSTPKDRRLSLVHAFNEGHVPVFLISLKAGGTGLNLTGADMVIHYDPWWNLAAQNQATDRAHRIGQTRQVTVYRLILKDTIEERILELQEAKKDLAEAILEGDGSSLMRMSKEELLALLT